MRFIYAIKRVLKHFFKIKKFLIKRKFFVLRIENKMHFN
jgi:hypothetical protein